MKEAITILNIFIHPTTKVAFYEALFIGVFCIVVFLSE